MVELALGYGAAPALAVGFVYAAKAIEGLCRKLTLGCALEVENNSDYCDIVSTMCDGVNLYDYQRTGCPTYNFQNHKIPKGSSLSRHQEITRWASNCPWTLHLRFACGEESIIRGHQKRVFSGRHNCTNKKDCFRVIQTSGHRIGYRVDKNRNYYTIKVSDFPLHIDFMKSRSREDEAEELMGIDPTLIPNLAEKGKNAVAERQLMNVEEALRLAKESFKYAKYSKDRGRIRAAERFYKKVYTKRITMLTIPLYTKKFQQELNRLKESKADTIEQVKVILDQIDLIMVDIVLVENDLAKVNACKSEDFLNVVNSMKEFQKYVSQKLDILQAGELINSGQLDKAEYKLHMSVLTTGGTTTEIQKLLQKIKDIREDRKAENLRQTGIGYIKSFRFNDARIVFNQAMAIAVDLGLKRQITTDIQTAWDSEAENMKKNALKLAKQNLFDQALSKLEEATKLKISQATAESLKTARQQILNDQVTWMRKEGDELVSKSKFEDAYKWFDSAISISCSSDLKKKVYLSQANAYWAHAKFCTDREDFQKAHEKFDMALKVQKEQLKVEKTIVRITNDKTGAYNKEAFNNFQQACELEDRLDQHEEMCKASQKLFDKAKELFTKAHTLNASKENTNSLGMCNAKIDGNNFYNNGIDLEVVALKLYNDAHVKKDFESAQEKLSDAMEELIKAKKLFNDGSKLCKQNLFKSSINSTKEAIEVTRMLVVASANNLLRLGDTKFNTMLENEKNVAGTSKTEKVYQKVIDAA